MLQGIQISIIFGKSFGCAGDEFIWIFVISDLASCPQIAIHITNDWQVITRGLITTEILWLWTYPDGRFGSFMSIGLPILWTNTHPKLIRWQPDSNDVHPQSQGLSLRHYIDPGYLIWVSASGDPLSKFFFLPQRYLLELKNLTNIKRHGSYASSRIDMKEAISQNAGTR